VASSSVRLAIDTTSPDPSISSPAGGSTLATGRPTFDGTSGTAPGDKSEGFLRIYSGPKVVGQSVQTLPVAFRGPTWSGVLPAGLPPGTYTAQVSQADVVGNIGRSPPVTFEINPAP
jgi:hypothetical protein